MKYLLYVLLAAVIGLTAVSCGEDRTSKTYTAQAAEANHGYRDTLQLTFEGKKLKKAEFESYDADGGRKSEAKDYPMSPPPSEWIPELSRHVEAAKTPAQVETVAGASISSENARKFYAAILKAKKEKQDPSVPIDVDVR